ncbi:bZIP transcription factor 27-like [Musa acuminata AAA Group]|uniref:bZIP transcription factor 27-like n=1 Tax=Musa acuminata AAA Group TaxID=214697 RepID=UPI0031E46EAE
MPGRNMEEVWKDISLSTLHQDVPSTPVLAFHPATTISSFRAVMLQDFIADAFKAENRAYSPSTHSPPASLSPTSDNSRQFFGYDLNASASASGSNAAQSESTKKRSPEKRPNRSVDRQSGVEQRKKRMIKNRESAARSRARKQAYRNELELEAARLLNENEMLKRESEQLRMTVAAQNPTASKPTLQRTLTAPF